MELHCKSIKKDENGEKRRKNFFAALAVSFKLRNYFAQQLSCMYAASSRYVLLFFGERVYFLHHDLSKMSYVGVWRRCSQSTFLESREMASWWKIFYKSFCGFVLIISLMVK